jgi:uncharacterized protein (DUF885 family)
MKTSILLVAAALALPCAGQPAKDLAKLADDMVEREFDLQPLRETWTEGRGPHAGKAAIPPTEKNVEKARATYRELLARLSAIPKDGLGTIDRNTHEMIRIRIQDQLDETKVPLDAMQLLAPTSGFVSQMIFMSTAGQPLDTEADYEAWLSRVEDSAAQVDGVITALEESKRAGWTTPRVLVEKALVQLATIADKPAGQGPMWSRVAKYPAAAGEAKRKGFEQRYREALEKRFIPAVKRLADYARDKYLPEARTTAGIGALPGGEAAYRDRVRANTTLDLTPEQVHAKGLSEMARIRPKLLEVAGRLGFKGTMKDLPGWIESNAANYPFATDDEILAYLRKVQARVTPELPKLFKRLPKAPLDVRLTPKELAATASASYSSPPIDGSRPGYFNMPVVDAKKRAVFDLTDLFLHEGVPGHHLDNSLRRELTELPRFRRNSWITAYGEGWGLYAESLGGDLGVYDDPWALLGYYTAEAQRAARLVVDTGLHSKGWTREQGIRYLVEERGSFERGAIVEVERYMAWPGQALAYKIGELEILSLRDQAKARLGSRFDIREFHEAVLGEGPLPLPLLRKRVEAWIAKQAA